MTSRSNVADRSCAKPYVAFSAVMDVVVTLRSEGELPQRLETKQLACVAGREASRLVVACAQLGLVDGAKRPTQRLRDLCAAYGAPDWQPALRRLLEDSYPEICVLPLESTSKNELVGAFASAYGHSGEMQRKIVAFFVAAASSAGMRLSRDVTSRRKISRQQTLGTAGGQSVMWSAVRLKENGRLSPIEMLTKYIYDPSTMPKGSPEELAIHTLVRFLRSAPYRDAER